MPTAGSAAHMRALGQATPEGRPSTPGCQPAGWSGLRLRSPGGGVRRGQPNAMAGILAVSTSRGRSNRPAPRLSGRPGRPRRAAREPVRPTRQVHEQSETAHLVAHWVLSVHPRSLLELNASLGQNPSFLPTTPYTGATNTRKAPTRGLRKRYRNDGSGLGSGTTQ